MEQYGVDIKDLSNYSLIVDTSVALPEEIASLIIEEFELWKKDKSRQTLYLSPERINYPDDAPNSELLQKSLDALENGDLPEQITVCEEDCEFYLVSSPESALAYALCAYSFIPCKLIKASVNKAEYIKMKNSL